MYPASDATGQWLNRIYAEWNVVTPERERNLWLLGRCIWKTCRMVSFQKCTLLAESDSNHFRRAFSSLRRRACIVGILQHYVPRAHHRYDAVTLCGQQCVQQ